MRWGENIEDRPSDEESARFHYYFNYIHAMRQDWEAERYSRDGEGGGGGNGPARPADDERMPGVRPGRSFPGLKTPLGGAR